MARHANSAPPNTKMSRRWKVKLGEQVEAFRKRENQLSLVLSLVIGALVGLVVVAFILLTGRLAVRMYPAGGAGWRRILVPTLGSLGTGWLLWRYFPYARGSGIPQTKFALFINDGYMSFRTALGKFFCCSASLASGIALGREGPSVQVGAGLSSVISRRLGLSKEQVKSLVPVGCSAALAAAFNTPIAAVLFSLEEIVGDLHAPVLGSVVLSSATSWMVLHLVLGDEPLFHVAGYHLVHSLEFVVYAALGVVGGLGSVSFVKLLLGIRARFMKLPKWTIWFQPVADRRSEVHQRSRTHLVRSVHLLAAPVHQHAATPTAGRVETPRTLDTRRRSVRRQLFLPGRAGGTWTPSIAGSTGVFTRW